LRLILHLAAAGLGLITLLTFAARLSWMFDLLSHFRLQYIVAATLLLAVALGVRAYPAAIAFAAIAVLHGWTSKGLWLDGAVAAAMEGRPLHVLSANVLRSNPAPERVASFVRTSDADLVVLVEAEQARWRQVLTSIGERYPYRAPEGWRDGAPIVLFSRDPIIHTSLIEPPTGQRPYLMAEIAIGAQSLTVVGVHPASPSLTNDGRDTRRRNRTLDHIAKHMASADTPVVVAGDFNTTPFSPHFVDLIKAAGLRNAAAGHGWMGTWPQGFWPARIPIDHILIKGPLIATRFERGPAIGSDHFPVLAELRLTASTATRRDRGATEARSPVLEFVHHALQRVHLSLEDGSHARPGAGVLHQPL
jgi:endonuclease/exonuclease/phosphatase (EEP) superfamily protein YafD